MLLRPEVSLPQEVLWLNVVGGNQRLHSALFPEVQRAFEMKLKEPNSKQSRSNSNTDMIQHHWRFIFRAEKRNTPRVTERIPKLCYQTSSKRVIWANQGQDKLKEVQFCHHSCWEQWRPHPPYTPPSSLCFEHCSMLSGCASITRMRVHETVYFYHWKVSSSGGMQSCPSSWADISGGVKDLS